MEILRSGRVQGQPGREVRAVNPIANVRAELDTAAEMAYSLGLGLDESVRAFRRAFVCMALTEFRGNQLRTAEALFMHRNTLNRALRDLGINALEFRRRK